MFNRHRFQFSLRIFHKEYPKKIQEELILNGIQLLFHDDILYKENLNIIYNKKFWKN
jgi:hypothetical protein